MELDNKKIEEKSRRLKNISLKMGEMSDSEKKSVLQMARISECIEKCRVDMGMTQIQFAEYMGVSQGMVSRWESRNYNFSIKSLNEICHRLDLEVSINLEKTFVISSRQKCSGDYQAIKWDAGNPLQDSAENGQNAWLQQVFG